MRSLSRNPAILIALVTAGLLVGCSQEGEVQLQNGTNWPATGTLAGRAADLESGEVMGVTVKFRSPLFSSDEKQVWYEFEGWTAFHQAGYVWIEPDATHRVTVLADAGCIGVENGTQSGIIDAVFLAPSSSPTWGRDLLGGWLMPGEPALWTVDAGFWDVRIEFTDGSWAELYENRVGLDELFEVTIVGMLTMGGPRGEPDDLEAEVIRSWGQAPPRRYDASKTAAESRLEARRIDAETWRRLRKAAE